MSRKTIFLFVLFLIAGLVLFGAYRTNFFSEKNLKSGSSGIVDYKNATYEIDGQRITLRDGVSETIGDTSSASKTITRYFGNEAKGDLNGDGISDVAFFLTQNGGSSGTFYYVAVAFGSASGYLGGNAVFVGDRVAPQTLEIVDGVLSVNYADRGVDEPMSIQPSFAKTLYFVVEKSRLVEAPVVVRFPKRDAILASPLSVAGVVRGTWFFEASFPVYLEDEQGVVLARGIAQAQGDWMTTDYVSFLATLDFAKPARRKGFLVLQKDNPSGLPEHDDSRKIPILFY